MSRKCVCHALVLKTTNIGEADRFCILLTRERGRMAARATGVRRPGSRMAGHLLPASTVLVECLESSSGMRITAARAWGEGGPKAHDFSGFLQAQQGLELLLRLLQDDEPAPELFDMSVQFLALCADTDRRPLLPFGFRLLSLLGLLPLSDEHAGFARLTTAHKDYLRRCAHESDLRALCDLPDGASLDTFLFGTLEENLSSPLRAPVVARASA